MLLRAAPNIHVYSKRRAVHRTSDVRVARRRKWRRSSNSSWWRCSAVAGHRCEKGVVGGASTVESLRHLSILHSSFSIRRNDGLRLSADCSKRFHWRFSTTRLGARGRTSRACVGAYVRASVRAYKRTTRNL